MTETTRRIIDIIRSIPPGKVASYRDAALAAGLPNGARQVARLLHSMSKTQKLPWHRIIRADGHIALPAESGGDLQAALLKAEGVKVSKEMRIDMTQYSFFRPGKKTDL
ncbi:methylated-DNA--protein-cysteine methyltransferase [Spirochaetia bacterium]|nr:methylated-DNA--protein-cysteine methyltransferase [Spirochaetia bacterium]